MTLVTDKLCIFIQYPTYKTILATKHILLMIQFSNVLHGRLLPAWQSYLHTQHRSTLAL